MTQEPLTTAWRYAGAEIWRPLFAQFGDEHPDLPIAVVRPMLDRPRGAMPIFVEPGLHATLDTLRKDVANYIDRPEDARLALKKIKPTFFLHDRAITVVISEIAAELREYDNASLDTAYRNSIGRFIRRHSLSYRLDSTPLRLVPLLYGELEKLYLDLRERAETDPNIQEALAAFENAWDRQALEWTQLNAKAAIQTASLLAEHMLVSASQGREREFSKALVAMRKDDRFPSNDFANIFDRAYTFANNYPNIRHPGDPNCVKRELQREDTILAALVFLGLSACAHKLCDGPA